MSRKRRRRWIGAGVALALAIAVVGIVASASGSSSAASEEELVATTTPVKHVVVLFQENESFDHYYGTYPKATNPAGEPEFHALAGTPSVNGLTETLLKDNPNAYNPKRLGPAEAVTCDMDHGYSDEQKAYDRGLDDRFVEYTGDGCADKEQVMDYFDGNTVTGLWNLAQHFALSDNSYDAQFGPSSPGAINLISGETHGAVPANLSGVSENGTDLGDNDPEYDDCGNHGLAMTGRNVGNLLDEKEITWGWFQGGFQATSYNGSTASCGSSHDNIAGASEIDYSAHHDPFEFYKSTSNPHHREPESEAMIGHDEPNAEEKGANHLYGIGDFDEAVKQGNLPAVSFLKAPEYEDGHPGYSDPLDEQTYLAEKLDELEESPEWESTAVIIAYDDSDGWYDHVAPPIVTPSKSASDFLSKEGECGVVTAEDESTAMDRCGYGPRLPMTVISPYAKQNYIATNVTDQTSILKFIEENWKLGTISNTSLDNKAGSIDDMFDFECGASKAPKVFLEPSDGEVKKIENIESKVECPAATTSGGTPTGTTGTSGSSNSAVGPPTSIAAPKPKAKKAKPKQAPKPKADCAVDGTGKRLELSCSVSDVTGRGMVRFRVYNGKSMLGTAAGTIHAGRVEAAVRAKRTLSGENRIVATVDIEGKLTVLHATVAMPGKHSVKLS